MSSSPRRAALLLATVLVAGAGVTAGSAQPTSATVKEAARKPFSLVTDRPVGDRLEQPEDRYALAGGCYFLEAPGQGFVTKTLTLGAKAQAEAFHFQATRLGDYLLAAKVAKDTSVPGATWDVRSYLSRGALGGLTLATAPSEDADFRLVAAGPKPDGKAKAQRFLLSLPTRGQSLAATPAGLTLAATGTPLTIHHVADDNPRDTDANGTTCADWPEVETGASGRPKPATGGPAAAVQGFFEAHVHGMAYEFLGGKVRCGSPWHPYGVEYALPDCRTTGNVYNGALEVPLGGKSPSDPATSYDPVGWPTFGYWPQHDTLTHEQYYWRWLERAYLGGLRLTTNLLVDNTALCTAFPVKKNSCNEMDGVRLQAKRLHEFQNYIDAQSGGPGEGWYRLVTDPGEARQTIRAGRLAVVMGIEVSELFDCGEVLDQAECTTAQIDTRLAEAHALGVRQMELVNKFDNALSGVTGDGGSTGIVVNSGQKQVSGHFWDMQSCADTHTEEHDREQLNAIDEAPGDGPDEIDALAGRLLNDFGGATRGIVAPAYGTGPHCNSRGLTPLGAHLVRAMLAKGMLFDPDHMSALAQRQVIDLVEKSVVPEEKAAAAKAGRPARQPAVLSSHSWANDTIYQRIYGLDGLVAPRTADAASFADRWAQNVGWATKNAPKGYVLGLGYGADTNGLGGQPGPRSKPKVPLSYAKPWKAPIGDVTLRQQKSGVKTFDINRDGVAHYGLFADWYREVQLAADEKHAAQGGGKAVLRDMLRGAESYLQLWERGVQGVNSCVTDGSLPQVEDLHALVGGNVDGFRDAIGQPVDRTDDAYVYCAQDANGNPVLATVGFDRSGTATGVTTEARTAPVAAVVSHGPAHTANASRLPATGGLPTSLWAALLLTVGLAMSAALRRHSRAGSF